MLRNSNDINKLKVSLTHLFLFLLLYLGTNSVVYSQSLSDLPKINSAYQNILKLKLSTGRNQLEALTPLEKESCHYYYTKNIADILELLITQDENLYDELSKQEDENLKGLKYSESSNPYKLFYESEIKLQWALVKTLFGEEISAGFSIRSANSAIEKNIKRFPDFNPNNKTYGLLYILYSTLPDNYSWLFNLLGMKGDIHQGLAKLENISNKSPYYLEAQLIKLLAFINILNKEDQALDLLQLLLKKNVDNLLLNYIEASTLIKFGQSELALEKLNKLQYHGTDYLFLPIIHYRIGEIYLQKQDYKTARSYFALFLNNYKGKDFIKAAWFNIFLSYWLTGDENMSTLHYKKAQESGRAFADSDKNANGILNEENYPNQKLMKMRLATDGGYFNIASNLTNLLTEADFETKKDKSEYYYRIGRSKHKNENLDEAVFYYLNTIKKSGNEKWYFAPNACLLTGYIYKEKQDIEKAEFYFNKALSYKKHKYKDGIDRKAKAALLELKNEKAP